jgi:hypothetical protein
MRRTFLHRIVLSAFIFFFVNSSSFSQNGTITGLKNGKELLQAATVSLGVVTKLTDHNGEYSFSVKPELSQTKSSFAGIKLSPKSLRL